MITQKRILVPIFNYKLMVVIFDKWKELKDIIPDDELDDEGRAITISGGKGALVAVSSKSISSVVHEAEHVKNMIWHFIGYNPQRDNDEVDAYLITYLYEKIIDVFYKHKGVKG